MGDAVVPGFRGERASDLRRGGASGSPGAGGGGGGGGAGASAASRARSNSSKRKPATRAMASPVTRSTQVVNLRAFRRHACTDGRMTTRARGAACPLPRGDAPECRRVCVREVQSRVFSRETPKIFSQSNALYASKRQKGGCPSVATERPVAPLTVARERDDARTLRVPPSNDEHGANARVVRRPLSRDRSDRRELALACTRRRRNHDASAALGDDEPPAGVRGASRARRRPARAFRARVRRVHELGPRRQWCTSPARR